MYEYSVPPEVEAVGQRIADEYEGFWQDVCADNSDINVQLNLDERSFTRLNEGQYYNMAKLFAHQQGRDDAYARQIANYEIHRDLGATSAEFALLASPASSELLLHGFSIYYDEPFSSTINRTEYTPGQPIYRYMQQQHEGMQQLHAGNPELFWKLIVTRTVQQYDGISEAEAGTLDFLDRLTGGSLDEYVSVQEQEHLGAVNLQRASLYALEKSMIEQLIKDGVQPLQPGEFFAVIQGYFADLIKQDEDRLNPYSNTDGHTTMPGEVALQAFFDRTK